MNDQRLCGLGITDRAEMLWSVVVRQVHVPTAKLLSRQIVVGCFAPGAFVVYLPSDKDRAALRSMLLHYMGHVNSWSSASCPNRSSSKILSRLMFYYDRCKTGSIRMVYLLFGSWTNYVSRRRTTAIAQGSRWI